HRARVITVEPRLAVERIARFQPLPYVGHRVSPSLSIVFAMSRRPRERCQRTVTAATPSSRAISATPVPSSSCRTTTARRHRLRGHIQKDARHSRCVGKRYSSALGLGTRLALGLGTRPWHSALALGLGTRPWHSALALCLCPGTLHFTLARTPTNQAVYVPS